MQKFKKVYVEITNQCNLSCSFCHQTKRTIQSMEPDFFALVLKEIKPVTDYIYLHVMGEPLLHPDFLNLLDCCEKEQIKVNLTTNGVLLSRWGKQLAEKKALRQINFSLHCLDGNSGMDANSYLDSVFSFVREHSQKKRIYFCYRLWNLGFQKEKNPTLQCIEKEYGIYIENGQTRGNGQKIKDFIYLQQTFPFLWPDLNGKEQFERGGCFGLKDHIGILSDGTVVPCCLDCEGDLSLGNLKEKTLLEILNGERAEAMRNGFRSHQRIEKLCRTCGWNLRKR